jgi:hypothetical protein
MLTPEAAKAVLVHEDEEALRKMAAIVRKVDEARQHRISVDLHGELTT